MRNQVPFFFHFLRDWSQSNSRNKGSVNTKILLLTHIYGIFWPSSCKGATPSFTSKGTSPHDNSVEVISRVVVMVPPPTTTTTTPPPPPSVQVSSRESSTSGDKSMTSPEISPTEAPPEISPTEAPSVEFEETEEFEISADFLLQWGILALVLSVFMDLRVTFLNIKAKADRWEFPRVESERIAIIPFFSRNASSGFNPLFIRTLCRILYPCLWIFFHLHEWCITWFCNGWGVCFCEWCGVCLCKRWCGFFCMIAAHQHMMEGVDCCHTMESHCSFWHTTRHAHLRGPGLNTCNADSDLHYGILLQEKCCLDGRQ